MSSSQSPDVYKRQLPRIAGRAGRNLLRRAGGHDGAAAVAPLGAQVDDVVGGFDHIQEMCIRDRCKGKRYNRETLEVRYKGKNIYEVLEMTVDEALPFFENLPKIYNRLKTLEEVGLGYVKLGQASTTLSGGEAQRVKLATELSKRSTGKTIYILDEPTTGLHSYDVQRLIDVLQRLVEAGNTIVVIEHNLDVIKTADHIIDLGPEGGDGGGTIVCTGTPEEVAACPQSYTGQYLARMLKQQD